MLRRVTKQTVDSIKPLVDKDTGESKEAYLWDDLLKGFGVRCRPTGRRYYILRYEVNGRTKQITLGRHGPLTPQQARAIAEDKLREVAHGRDPEVNNGKTVADLCDLFMEKHLYKRKDGTKTDYALKIKNHIIPRLGKLELQSVNYRDIEDFHYKLRNKPRTANYCLSILSAMFNKAEKWGLRPAHSNPCLDITRHKERSRERFLSVEELDRLISVLDKHQDNMPTVVNAIRLLVMTGCRKQEILKLQWDEVKGDRLVLKDAKTGGRTVHLQKAAQDLLASIQPVDGNPYVITGRHGKGHLIGFHKAWDRIRKEAGLADVRCHDLRHSFASFAVTAGQDLYRIGAHLGHRSTATTKKYAHLEDKVLQQSAKAIGDVMFGRDGTTR